MATVLNRTTKQLLTSVDASLYAEPEWKIIHNKSTGSLSEVNRIASVRQKYRKIDASNNVVEMSAAEKQAVDDALKADYVSESTSSFAKKEVVEIAGMSVLLDYINAIRANLVPPQSAISEETFLQDIRNKINADYEVRAK